MYAHKKVINKKEVIRDDSEGVVMSKIESEIFIPIYLYDKDHNFTINFKIEKVRKDRVFYGDVENINNFCYEFLDYHRSEIIKDKPKIPDESSIKYYKIIGKKIKVSIEIIEDVSADEETYATTRK